ncbi:MAG: hypothetical protein V5A31_10825 [Haloferacaceae archaeon]
MFRVLQGLLTRFRDDDRSSPAPRSPDPAAFEDPVLLARTPGARKYHAPQPDGERPRCGGSTPGYRLVERTDAAADYDACANPSCRAALDRDT